MKKKLKKLTKKRIKHVFEESEESVSLRDFIRISQPIFDDARKEGASVRDLHWLSKKAGFDWKWRSFNSTYYFLNNRKAKTSHPKVLVEKIVWK